MSTDVQRPILTVLAGPHGAGKSFLYDEKLAHRDEKLGPRVASSEREAISAAIADKKALTIETTLASRRDVDLVREAKAAGYEIRLYHVGVQDADQAQQRIAARVAAGGERRPEQAIRDSFEFSQQNVRDVAALAKQTFVYDNAKADAPLRLAAAFQDRETVLENNPPLWARMQYSEDLQRRQETPAPHVEAFVSTLQLSLAEHGKGVAHNAPDKDRAQFEGRIIGRTTTHTIQQTSPTSTVMHDNQRLDKLPHIGDSVLISYNGPDKGQTLHRVPPERSGGKLAYEAYEPKPGLAGEVTPMSQAMADSLRRDKPSDALKKFPELTPAIAMLAAAQKQLTEQTPESRTKVLGSLRDKLATAIERNEPLQGRGADAGKQQDPGRDR